MTPIHFGTSGWRALIAEDFTFRNVRLAVRAIADHLNDSGAGKKGVILARDGRFLGEEFVQESAEVLASAGVPSLICGGLTPTPVVASAILDRGAGGAINFTASHNPSEYQGLKFNPASAAPADPAVTKDIEARVEKLDSAGGDPPKMALDKARAAGLVRDLDPYPDYEKRLARAVRWDLIEKRPFCVIYDAMYGCGGGVLPRLLRAHGWDVTALHEGRDVLFGGRHPEPSPEVLPELIQELKTGRYDLGLANDGDADRFGVLDAGGRYITPNELICILVDYLSGSRGRDGSVVRTVATTLMVDRIAMARGLKVRETGVGFKYIAEAMAREKVLLGGEESGGLSLGDHLPEKDGILACLLAAEVMAVTGKNLDSYLATLEEKHGTFYSGRVDIRLDAAKAIDLKKKLFDSPPSSLAGRKVTSLVRTDGLKFLLADGSWCLTRFSGTEPLARWYGEAQSPEALAELLAEGRKLFA